MLYFGSRNFGQANFGKGLIATAVDESLTTSTMQVTGYRILSGTIDPSAVVNDDVAAGVQKLGFFHIQPRATIIASGLQMQWQAWTNLGQGTVTMSASSHIAWDSQLVDATTWTTQNVD